MPRLGSCEDTQRSTTFVSALSPTRVPLYTPAKMLGPFGTSFRASTTPAARNHCSIFSRHTMRLFTHFLTPPVVMRYTDRRTHSAHLDATLARRGSTEICPRDLISLDLQYFVVRHDLDTHFALPSCKHLAIGISIRRATNQYSHPRVGGNVSKLTQNSVTVPWVAQVPIIVSDLVNSAVNRPSKPAM
jgi:hypothetical protein